MDPRSETTAVESADQTELPSQEASQAKSDGSDTSVTGDSTTVTPRPEAVSQQVSTATEAAEEAEEPVPPSVRALGQDMFSKLTDFLHGELTGSCEDYELLERMNRAAISRYTDMKSISSSLSSAMTELNAKYAALQPYLDKIDEVESAVETLEQAAYRLDAYSKKLEAKFRHLEKR